MGNAFRSGNLKRIPSGTKYVVSVKTGDKKGAGTDANVCIILINEEGKSSEAIKLDCVWRDDFEAGSIDEFPIKNYDLGPIRSIEVWRDSRGLLDDWFVEWVKVKDMATEITHMFPVHRWIKLEKVLLIKEFDAHLPIDSADETKRKDEIESKCKSYEFEQKVEGLWPQVKSLPKDEMFSNEYNRDLKRKKYGMLVHMAVKNFTTGSWKSPEDIIPVYTGNMFYKPGSVDTWMCDKAFARQRLSHCNPTVIRRCFTYPERPAVTDDMMKPLMEDMSIEDAIAAKRLYCVDYVVMKDLVCTDNKPMIAPSALFFVNKDKDLVPVAIQLVPEPSPDNPVFSPTDPQYTWLLAKMWFNHADANFHQSVPHLGFTHFVVEAIAIAVHRSLSPSHPIFRLLAPHFLYLMAVNSRGLEILISEGGWMDSTFQIGRIGMLNLIKAVKKGWRMGVQGILPRDLEERGVDDPSALPFYPYRDDALLLYNAIHAYVSEVVDGHYKSSESLTDDHEVQELARLLSSDDGAGIHGVPGDGKFESTNDLKNVLASTIFIGSVGHAAVNFSQYDDYAFPVNYPSQMMSGRPTDKSERTEADIMKVLPEKKVLMETMLITRLLSERGTKPLGDFEVQYVFDPIGIKALEEFRAELKRIEGVIEERNKERKHPYTYLKPSEIPNAISI